MNLMYLYRDFNCLIYRDIKNIFFRTSSLLVIADCLAKIGFLHKQKNKKPKQRQKFEPLLNG
jgi:hypothetical protein